VAPPAITQAYEPGWALDADNGVLAIFGPGAGVGFSEVSYYDINSNLIVGYRRGPSQTVDALAHDPIHFPPPMFQNTYSAIFFDSLSRNVYRGTSQLFGANISVNGADWYDRGEYIIGSTGFGTQDFYEIHADTGQITWRGTNAGLIGLSSELAYDKDINILWYLDRANMY
jgi:hypothetical protein